MARNRTGIHTFGTACKVLFALSVPSWERGRLACFVFHLCKVHFSLSSRLHSRRLVPPPLSVPSWERGRLARQRASTGVMLPAIDGRLAPSRPCWASFPCAITSWYRISWCERGDLNPYPFRDWNLNPARLPIPPLSREKAGQR